MDLVLLWEQYMKTFSKQVWWIEKAKLILWNMPIGTAIQFKINWLAQSHRVG